MVGKENKAMHTTLDWLAYKKPPEKRRQLTLHQLHHASARFNHTAGKRGPTCYSGLFVSLARSVAPRSSPVAGLVGWSVLPGF